MDSKQVLQAAQALLETQRRVIFMMCGLAGSGKTTLAQSLVSLGCQRLSIDEEIWERHGRYGIDYDASDYDRLQVAAEARLRIRLEQMMSVGTQAVIDFSFWSRSTRADYR